MITGVVLARNERLNIVDCLKTFRPHVSELILIDMESSDDTVALARPFVDQVLCHPLVDHFDAARNVAIDAARHEWLWFVDADERVSDKTAQLVHLLIAEHGDEFAALMIPFKSHFCGRWIEHSGWWPGYTMPRVLRRGFFRFGEQLHSGVQCWGRELRLPADPTLAIEHFSYRSVEHYLEKFNRYTSIEARALAANRVPLDWRLAIRHMVHDLWQYYDCNQGRLDGWYGWILAWFAGQYRWVSHAKLLDSAAYKDQATCAAVPNSLDEVVEEFKKVLTTLRRSRPTLPLGIVVHSPIWDISGYADDGRILLKAAAETLRPVAAVDIHWSDRTSEIAKSDALLFRALLHTDRAPSYMAITNCIVSLSEPDPCASINILRTTFETDRIPQSWLARLEGFDEIWIWSQHNEVAFRRSGVAPEKLRRLPGFVDTSLYAPEGAKLDLPAALHNKFVFLSVFDWQLRKGWDVLLKAYCAEFKEQDGAGLLLKISRQHGHTLDQIVAQADEILASLGMCLRDRSDIVIWDDCLSAGEMSRLYRSVQAFVLASRGEGWGRPWMEAMSAGLATIGTSGSGNADFMTDDNSFLVAAKPCIVSQMAASELSIYAGHRWLEPDLDELRRCLRQVYSDKNECRRRSACAVADMRAKFDLGSAAQMLESLVRQAENRFRPNMAKQALPGAVRVVLEGEFFAGHSFSNVNEQLTREFLLDDRICLSLTRLLLNPTVEDLVSQSQAQVLQPYWERSFKEGPQVTIRHMFPPNWTKPATGKWVHIQPWEYGALPVEWVGPLRDHVDEIWSPSQYVRQVYRSSGIPDDKIQVIPWGIDPDVYQPSAPPLHLPSEKGFKFLFVGGTIPRKGFDTLLAAFLKEFSAEEDVCLVVKDQGTKSFYRYGNSRDQVLEAIHRGDRAEIVYLEHELSPGLRASLYTACNCLVAPYRGEGFGLPVLEAMASGLAPIVPQGGATDDFVDEQTGWLLPAKQVDCHHEWRLVGPATELFIEPSELRRSLRRAFSERDETKHKGARASLKVHSGWTWSRTVSRMVERLHHLASAPARPSERTHVPRRPSISACIVSRNSEPSIADCLARVAAVVGEIIVVDLGSTDRTCAIASEYGARVFPQVWQDDYSSAWNTALTKATSEWILTLYPDERLDEVCAEQLATLIAGTEFKVNGFSCCISSTGSDNGKSTRHAVRIFRNRHDICFEGRSCTAAEPRGLSADRVRPSPYRISRSLLPNTDVRLGQYLENARLLHLDRREQPQQAHILIELARINRSLGNHFHAECYYWDAARLIPPGDPLLFQILSELSSTYLQLHDPHRVDEICQQLPEDRRENFWRQVTELVSQSGSNGRPESAAQNGESAGDRRLYLGAGTKRLAGYIHVDIAHESSIDVVHDLNQVPWPWANSSVDYIVAEDVVEHLHISLVAFCDEAWRVQRQLKVLTGDN